MNNTFDARALLRTRPYRAVLVPDGRVRASKQLKPIEVEAVEACEAERIVRRVAKQLSRMSDEVGAGRDVMHGERARAVGQRVEASQRDVRQSAKRNPKKKHPRQPWPRDGRPGKLYPGVPDPDLEPGALHTDVTLDRELRSANELHYKWVLLVLFFMAFLDVRLVELSALVGRDEETVKAMLTGESYGKADTRVALVWELVRIALERGCSPEWIAARVAQWGDWAPDGVSPCWRLERGRAEFRPPRGTFVLGL